MSSSGVYCHPWFRLNNRTGLVITICAYPLRTGSDGNNWKTKPSIRACGSCHNNVNFATGAYKLEYAINSVTVDSAKRPVVKFTIKKDGTAVNFGTYNAATNANLIPNTTGGYDACRFTDQRGLLRMPRLDGREEPHGNKRRFCLRGEGDGASEERDLSVCHGTANNAAFNETVPTIKGVHRWW